MRALTFGPIGLPTLFALALSSLVLVAPGHAQELPSSDPRERAAQRYQTSTWPKAGPVVSGWTPDGFKAPGLERLRLKIDARRAEAQLVFARPVVEKEGKAKPAARLRIRRHSTPSAARDHLLAHLAACTLTLEREEGLGEVAFGVRARGKLVYLAGVRGDLSYTLRAEPKEDLQPLAAALDAALRLASKPSEVQPAPLAALRSSKALPAAPGQPVTLELTFRGAVRSLAFRSPEGVSVLRTKAGCVVYSDSPGEVEFELVVIDKELRTSRHALRVTAR